MMNITCPASTSAPSVYMRLSRKPSTRARISTSRELWVCAVNSKSTGVDLDMTVTRVTSTADRGAWGGGFLHAASDSTTIEAADRKRDAWIERNSAVDPLRAGLCSATDAIGASLLGWPIVRERTRSRYG